MTITSVEEFYKTTGVTIPEGMNKEIGHFNIFKVDELVEKFRQKPAGTPPIPYNRRAYYKISLIRGKNQAEYADKVIDIERNALLFGTPKIPYNWIPADMNQSGFFCIFTEDFLLPEKSGMVLDELPIFKPGGFPVFQLSDKESEELNHLFIKMHMELASNYVFKYDLLRNYLMELIHYGQKLQPATALYPSHNAAARVTSLFVELLERQFPIESTRQTLRLRTAKDYANQLSVHVNHLNKVIKENTGRTTTELITGRITQEAKILLKQTDWNISEIAYSLGFEEVAHFSNFFKKQTSLSPLTFRS
jgi:AraC family transcriptional regulator, transcriptional activator of pobA